MNPANSFQDAPAGRETRVEAIPGYRSLPAEDNASGGGRGYMHVRIIDMVASHGCRDRDIYECPAFGPDHRVCMTGRCGVGGPD